MTNSKANFFSAAETYNRTNNDNAPELLQFFDSKTEALRAVRHYRRLGGAARVDFGASEFGTTKVFEFWVSFRLAGPSLPPNYRS